MGNYKNGIETKNTLFQSCQKLFYEKGYLNTTVKDIVSDANSKLGLFTYYFNSKEAVAHKIYRDFVYQIPQKLKSVMEDEYPQDFLLIDMTEFRAFFLCIHANPQIAQFYLEMSYTDAFIQTTKEVAQTFIRQMMEEYNTDNLNTMLWTPHYFQSVTSLTSGMEVQFFRDLIRGQVEMSFDDGIDMYLEEYYRFLLKDLSLIKKSLRKSRHLLRDYSFKVLPDFQVIIEKTL